MNALRLAIVATIAVALTGCEALRSIETREAEPWVKSGAPRPANDLESLLLYFDYIGKLPASELGGEHENARVTFARTQSNFNRVRLAMALSVPNTEINDDPRALELLEPMLTNEDSTLHGLASLMSAYLQQRRQLDSSVQTLQQNVQTLQQNARGLQQKLDALKSMERSLIEREQTVQQNARGLQQKLDALKSMERSLTEREQAGQKRR